MRPHATESALSRGGRNDVDSEEKSMSNKAIANLLGVTEGAVRYRLRRAENGQADGRCRKKAFAAKYDAAIRSWVRAQQDPEGEAPAEPESDMPVTG